MTFYRFDDEISPLGELFAKDYLKKGKMYPIEPESIAERHFGLQIAPTKQLESIDVISGIDSTQSIIFIDYDIYMRDDRQHICRQAIAHELGHIIYDAPDLRLATPKSIEEAFEVHRAFRQRSGVETRANMFAGALLVPRSELIKKSITLLLENLKDIKATNPNMEVRTLFRALGGTRLARFFGVSDQVIEWRINSENLYELMGVSADSKISELEEGTLRGILNVDTEEPSLTERIENLIPQEVLVRLRPSA